MNSGDREVLEGWLSDYGPRLLMIAESFADGPTEAEDILHDARMIAVERRHQQRDQTAVGAWLASITLNLCKSLVRKRSRRNELMRIWGATAQRGWSGRQTTLEEELSHVRLWRAIADLSQLQRTVLLHRFLDDLSTKQTAERIQRAEGTVKACLHRALARLRSQLGSLDGSSGSLQSMPQEREVV